MSDEASASAEAEPEETEPELAEDKPQKPLNVRPFRAPKLVLILGL